MLSHKKISKRAQHLLKALIEHYIRDGQPVGSLTLSREADIELSSATIRTIMADLEDMGLLCSPHTSAGRVPTVLGYRFFIDTLLQIKPLNNEEASQLRQHFNLQDDYQSVLAQASQLLSEVTHLASVVMLPRQECCALRHVEFLSLSGTRVLVILVFNEHEVHNRIIHTSRRYTESELEQAANYLNAACTGKDIQTVRQDLLRELRETRQHMDEMMHTVIEMADKVFTDPACPQPELVMAGQTNLMNVAELSDIEKLRLLFVAFNQKCDILHLLDQALTAQGVKIFIGEECGYKVFDDCSVVTSPYYRADGYPVGVLGVIGPTRMAYDRVIPIVDLTAKLLTSALNPHAVIPI